jgi:hypothetical protein
MPPFGHVEGPSAIGRMPQHLTRRPPGVTHVVIFFGPDLLFCQGTGLSIVISLGLKWTAGRARTCGAGLPNCGPLEKPRCCACVEEVGTIPRATAKTAKPILWVMATSIPGPFCQASKTRVDAFASDWSSPRNRRPNRRCEGVHDQRWGLPSRCRSRAGADHPYVAISRRWAVIDLAASGLHACSISTSVPQKSFGCRNSTGLPCAPIFGLPSPSTRAPCDLSLSRAAKISSTS